MVRTPIPATSWYDSLDTLWEGGSVSDASPFVGPTYTHTSHRYTASPHTPSPYS